MIHATTTGAVAHLELDAAAARNALEPSDWQALDDAVARALADPAVRVLLLSGRGGTFCAGGNLKTMPERLALPYEVRRRALQDDARVITRLRAADKLSIARIEGACAGAGLSLALACDVRIAADNATFAASFHKVGLSTDFGLAWLLTQAVGAPRALDLVTRARTLFAGQALELGLITEVAPVADLAQRTQEYLDAVAAGPPLAIAATKRSIYAAVTSSLTESLALEADAQARCSRSDDAQEGVRAFREKRSPIFRGE